MKVLLLSPPYLSDYMRNARCDFVSISKTQWYPIWLGYCGAFLEKHGHEVKLIDAPSYGYDHHKTRTLIQEYKPDLMVVYTGRMSEDNDIEFSEQIVSALGIRAVFVGTYASINPETLVRKANKITAAVKGEFEYPVLEMLEGKKYQDIGNLVYKENGSVITNKIRPFLNGYQLDEIPFVSEFFNRHLDLKHYKAHAEYYPFIDLMTGRGCAWGICTYCLWVHSFIPGRTYNVRSIENVVEEFRFIKEQMPRVRSIMIQDDTLPDARAVELSEALLKNNIKIPWSCYARADMGYDTMATMKKAGCRNLHVGYESANPQVLKNIKKGLSVERMTQFTKDAKKVGLRIHGDFAIGFNGETTEGIKQTIAWAKELDPDTAQFQIMIPFPSTPFYDHLLKNNCLLNGEPDYPQLPNEELRYWAKRAYREFYLDWRYLKRALKDPYEHLFSRMDTIVRALPAIFLDRWKV